MSSTTAAEIGQAVVNLNLEVKCQLVRAHYHCHDRGSNSRSGNLKVNSVIIVLGLFEADFCCQSNGIKISCFTIVIALPLNAPALDSQVKMFLASKNNKYFFFNLATSTI